nr:hypothetical protein BaRGS_004500 [Batillaria attramentaria]
MSCQVALNQAEPCCLGENHQQVVAHQSSALDLPYWKEGGESHLPEVRVFSVEGNHQDEQHQDLAVLPCPRGVEAQLGQVDALHRVDQVA